MPTEAHFTLYLDETGDHLLYSEEEYLQNSELESHCTLLGYILQNDVKPIVKEGLKALKREFWKTDEVILHSVKIRHKQGCFALFHYIPEMYEKFKVRLMEIIKLSNPVIVCSSLDKRLWIKKYPRKYYFKDDPYDQAFIFLLEKYARFLNDQKYDKVVGRISVEKRDPARDKSLRETYTSVKRNGTQFRNKNFFDKLSDKMDFDSKGFNIPGLQLSDYCSYPFYINHKFPTRDNKLYELLKTYIYNCGHKKWP